MQMTFGEKVNVNAPISKVLDFAANIREISECIPDSEDFKQIDATKFTVKVRVNVGFFHGSFVINCTHVEQNEKHIVYDIEGRGIGGNVKVALTMDLRDIDGASTGITWNAKAEFSGIISGLSETVIKGLAKEKIDEIVANMRARVEKTTKN